MGTEEEKPAPESVQMNENSAVLTGRNALIVTVIALAFNPISGVIGYRISKKLSRPRIKIEFINPNIGYKKITLEKDIVSDIKDHKNVFDKITKLDFAKLFENPPQDLLKLAWGMQSDSQISGDGQVSFEFIESVVEYKADILYEYDNKTQLIQDNLEILSTQQIFDSGLLKKVPDFKIDPVEEAGKDGPKAAYNIMQSWLEKANEERDAFKRVLSSFNAILEKGRERSGEISFEVGLLNEGDSDGVVYPDGELHIGGRIIKVESKNRQYGVIKPHSFSKYVFQIKEEEVHQNNLDHLNTLVSKGMAEDYTFIINATTTRIKSMRKKLPIN